MKKNERTRNKLKKEYQGLNYTMNKLQWCSDKAREFGMSYGQFMSWLGV